MTNATENTAQGAEIARKITISTVAGKAAKWFEKLMNSPTKSLRLMQVFGFATFSKPDASEYGEFVKISGNFRAVNLDTGEITNAPQVILPNFLGQALHGALMTPDRSGPVKFAFEIGVVYDPAAATKYVYTIRDLMPPQQDDPLAAMQALIMGAAKPALDAPNPTPEPTPEPTPPPAPARRK